MVLFQQQQQQGLQQLLQQIHAQQLPHGAHGPLPLGGPHPGLPVGPGGLLFGGALASGPGAPLAAQPHSLLKPGADLHNSRESAELKGPSSLPEERLVSFAVFRKDPFKRMPDLRFVFLFFRFAEKLSFAWGTGKIQNEISHGIRAAGS